MKSNEQSSHVRHQNFRLFFFNTKHRYDFSAHIYPHRIKRKQHLQKQSQYYHLTTRTLEHTHVVPKEPAHQLLVQHIFTTTAHISMFVQTAVTSKQGYFKSGKCAQPRLIHFNLVHVGQQKSDLWYAPQMI